MGMALFISIAGLLILLVTLAGWLYEKHAEQSDRIHFPYPGQLIDVGGYRMHLLACGDRRMGQPIVVLESGDGVWSSYWHPVQLGIARFVRVCTYDRAGYGWSEPGPKRCTLEQIASELHLLLQNAGEYPPYLLVGHSFGGLLVRQYARQFPQEVAGIVFVDAIHENFIRYMPDARKTVPAFQQGLRLLGFLAYFGLARLVFRNLVLSRFASIFPAPEDRKIAAALTLRPQYFNRLLAENIAGNQTMEEGLPASLGDLPVVVIQAHYPEIPGRGFTPERWKVFRESWFAMGKDLLSLSANSQLTLIEGGHIVQNEQPEVVVEAVRRLLEASTEGTEKRSKAT